MNLFYDKAAHKDWSGGEESAGCYLFMSALVQYLKDNNIEFDQTPLEVYPDGKEEDMLRKETRNFAGRPATILYASLVLFLDTLFLHPLGKCVNIPTVSHGTFIMKMFY